MLRVLEIEHDGKKIELLPGHLSFSENNTYTVLVGKNGLGKSRLLTNIAKTQTRDFYDLNYYSEHESSSLASRRQPFVIAVSTSPFDKFPNPRNKRHSTPNNYKYVGMRGEGMFSASSAVSLISSASKGLLNKLLNQQNNANLIDVFGSLSFSPNVSFIFKPAFLRYNEKWESKTRLNHYTPIETDDASDVLMLDERYAKNFHSLDTETRSTAAYAMSNLANYFTERKALTLDVDFITNECFLSGELTYPHIINSIQTLMDLGLVRLIDLQLHKDGYGELNLRRASSGEQCLLVLMLGIAGHIEDGSLILIDEPEISLHPRWQEEFMRLLTSAFEGYKHCHFIIATHSPQIISRMNSLDSYVYSLSKGELYESSYFNNKSADFQLAELFDAPGLMNEYISRVSFNLIAKLRTNKKVDAKMYAELQRLTETQLQLSPIDPTIKLIDSVRELYNYYASN